MLRRLASASTRTDCTPAVQRTSMPALTHALRSSRCESLLGAGMAALCHMRIADDDAGVANDVEYRDYFVKFYAPTARSGSFWLMASEVTMKSTMPSPGLIAFCKIVPSQFFTAPRFWPAFTLEFTLTNGYQKPSCSLRSQRNRSSKVNSVGCGFPPGSISR